MIIRSVSPQQHVIVFVNKGRLHSQTKASESLVFSCITEHR